MLEMNLQFFGGRGGNSGKSSINTSNGSVVISEQKLPQGTVYYMTGTRNVETHWDDNDNYLDTPIIVKENVRLTFKSRKDAENYAKTQGYKYI